MDDIQKALRNYIKARDKLTSLASRQYTKNSCPLNLGDEGHRNLAQALWGTGCYQWTCEFCGKEFTD